MLQNLESNTWKPNASFKENYYSSLVVDKGKGWGEQIRDKTDKLERGMQGDKILRESADWANEKIFEIQVLMKYSQNVLLWFLYKENEFF